jgi:hypothetical protein
MFVARLAARNTGPPLKSDRPAQALMDRPFFVVLPLRHTPEAGLPWPFDAVTLPRVNVPLREIRVRPNVVVAGMPGTVHVTPTAAVHGCCPYVAAVITLLRTWALKEIAGLPGGLLPWVT